MLRRKGAVPFKKSERRGAEHARARTRFKAVISTFPLNRS